MKRILPIFLSLTFLLLAFAGCSKPAQPNEGKFTDSQEYLIDPVEEVNMCESEDSCYYLYNNFIYVIDKKTHKATVLCNKSDCLHDKESDYKKCSGYFSCSGASVLRYYDGSLYVSSNEERRDKDGNLHFYSQIYRASSDGANRELVYETDEMEILDFKTHRGFIYITASKYDEEGNSGSNSANLYRLPIDGGKVGRLKVKYYDKRRDFSNKDLEGFSVSRQHFFGNYMYIRYEGRENGKAADSLARVNLNTLKSEEIGTNLNLTLPDFTVLNDKLYYVSDQKLYSADTDGTGEKFIKDLSSYGYKGGYTVFAADGKNVVVNCYNSDNASENTNGNQMLFNPKTKTIEHIKIPYISNIGGTPDCLLVSNEDADKDNSLYYVDKTKLNNENYCKKIYDFPRK